MNLPYLENCNIAIIGLGYVGLPLAIEFAKKNKHIDNNNLPNRNIIGFDINFKRIKELRNNIDYTNEITKEELKEAKYITFTNDESLLKNADVFIVTVPTPIDEFNKPNLKYLRKASELVGKSLKERYKSNKSTCPVVIFESTVYPGATEEYCVPIIESFSNLIYNLNSKRNTFACGYSPERINPGDKNHRLDSIVKVTSGSNDEVALWIEKLYQSIIKAGTFRASSIKVAEAAKVIENTQRDINIALVNELSIIFKEMEIDTLDVLAAAETKWNFLKFRPGLVGGHCIGVDPYYLTTKSEQMGYSPQLLLSGRRINDGMGKWIVQELVLEMSKRDISVKGKHALVLGLTFKENCPDIRNTKVEQVVKELSSYKIKSTIVDPVANKQESKEKYNLDISNDLDGKKDFDIVILAVAHNLFKNLSETQWINLAKPNAIYLDIKGIVPRTLNPIRI